MKCLVRSQLDASGSSSAGLEGLESLTSLHLPWLAPILHLLVPGSVFLYTDSLPTPPAPV